MKIPKIKIIHTAQTEIFSLMSYFYRVKTHFYHTNQYYVLPYLIPKNKRTVYIPDIEILRNKIFIKLCNYYDYEIENKYPQALEKMINHYKFEPIQKKHFLTDFNSILTQFCKILDQIFPSILDDVSNIIIMPTRYGTTCSEYSSQSPYNSTIRFFVRNDTNLEEIFYMFLMERINRTKLYTDYSWEERMAICEHTMLFTPLKQLFPDFKPVLNRLQNDIDPNLKKESVIYHQKLGINVLDIFLIKHGEIYINSKFAKFTPTEKSVLKVLIENKNQIVSFEQIAEAMWQDKSTEKYSLYAMSKCVERIREKLKT